MSFRAVTRLSPSVLPTVRVGYQFLQRKPGFTNAAQGDKIELDSPSLHLLPFPTLPFLKKFYNQTEHRE